MNLNNITSKISKHKIQDINEMNPNEKQSYDNYINSLIEQLIIPKVFHTQ